MGNILSYMKENDYNIHIKYYGVNDFGTEHDLKQVIEGKDILEDYYEKKNMKRNLTLMTILIILSWKR